MPASAAGFCWVPQAPSSRITLRARETPERDRCFHLPQAGTRPHPFMESAPVSASRFPAFSVRFIHSIPGVNGLSAARSTRRDIRNHQSPPLKGTANRRASGVNRSIPGPPEGPLPLPWGIILPLGATVCIQTLKLPKGARSFSATAVQRAAGQATIHSAVTDSAWNTVTKTLPSSRNRTSPGAQLCRKAGLVRRLSGKGQSGE